MNSNKWPQRRPWYQKMDGMSLIEVLIAAGVLASIALVFATFSANFSQESRALAQKSEILDYTRDLQAQLLDSRNCDCQFTGLPRMNATVPGAVPELEMPQLTASCMAGAPIVAVAGQPLPGTQTGLKIKSIRYSKIKATGNPNEFMGQIETTFEGTVRQLKPSMIKQRVSVDPASPSSAKPINGCVSNNTPTCITRTNRGLPPDYVSVAKCANNEYIISGGGNCAIGGTSFSGNLSPTQKAFLHTSGVSGNTWIADCFESTKSQDAASEAWALCCQK
jgi:type II secretory pathway pseudopilin PulG